jgi:hypothetical protein
MTMKEEAEIKKLFVEKIAKIFKVKKSQIKEIYFERAPDRRNCKGFFRIGKTGKCTIFGDTGLQCYDTYDTEPGSIRAKRRS